MSIDPRLIERRKTVAEDKAKRNVGRLLKFLLFVVVVGAAVWLIFSPWLSVSMVTTSGIEISEGQAILANERVVAGTPMILINSGRVEAALLDDPWVAEATVEKDWPDSVTVTVVERSPVAWVRTGGGWTRRAVDGVALPSARQPGGQLPRIEMPELSDSDALTSVDLLGALEFAAASQIERDLVLTRIDDEIWASIPGYQVRLGRADDMSEKARSLDALLQKNLPHGSTLVLIAPRYPSVMTPGKKAQDGAGVGEGDTAATDDSGNDGNDGP